MKTNNRRDFLRKSMLGISGAALMPSVLKSYPPAATLVPAPEIPFRTMGRTGIKTPLISFGTAGVTSPGLLKAAYEAGVRLFFSANYYGEGNNEMLVGDALKNMPRESYFIGTASVPDGIDMRTGLLPRSFTADSYMKKTEASLKRFGIDYIDFVLLPYAGKKETVLNDAVLKTFEAVKKQGKAKFVGIASHGDTEEALNAAAGSGIYDVAMIAYNFKLQNPDSLNAAISNAVKAGMGIVAMKSTAGAERQKSGQPFNSDAALKWVLQNMNISSIVSGMTSLEELNKNLAMVQNLKMTSQEMKDLGIASLPSTDGLYCRQCKQCLSQCPYNIDIPTMMRSYMYAYGYRNTEHAWYALSDAGIKGNPCNDCESCKVNCSSGFDIKNKVTKIARLSDFPKEFLHS